jgi:hypothetical protein
MSAAVADRTKAWFGTDNTTSKTFTGHSFEKYSDGTALVKAVEVFKAGTFRDSMGEQATWLPEHLMQMVSNFDLLKSQNIFPSPPARRDHSGSIDKVMGYVDSLSTDGNKLFADIHVTEPTDVDKLVRGTYRARSLEVGMYITNDEAAFWPVVFGVAYVDLPAVEGLFAKSKEISYFSQISQGEGNMGNQNSTGTAVDDRPPQTVINLNGFGSGQMSTGTGDNPAPPTPPTPGPTPTPPTPAPTPSPTTPPTASFRINGQETVDFAAVQTHISTLEGIIKTVNEDARKSFCKKLSDDKKILVTQVPALEAFALSLSPEAYEAWVKTYEGAQAVPLLATHGAAGTGGPDAGAPENKVADEIAVQEGILTGLRQAGFNKEKIEKSAAFQRLTELKSQQS